MDTIAGLKFIKAPFDKHGQRKTAGPLAPAGVTDLIVVSHGWHVDPDDAQAWYHKLIGHLVAEAGAGWSAAGRTFGVTGVFWPSDKFRDDLSGEGFALAPEGGAAAALGDMGDASLIEKAADLAALLSLDPVTFDKKVRRAVNGGGDADELVELLRLAIAPDEADEEVQAEHGELFERPGREIIADLAMQGSGPPSADPASGGVAAVASAQNGGQALGVFSGARAGVARLLNQVAYFELKKRAGIVGKSLGKLLEAEPGLGTVRIHLVGHSFGARLVTAATLEMTQRLPASLTLLQAAFSHNSFGLNVPYLFKQIEGGFRDVVAKHKVSGPIAITHTWNDQAVGLAYPAASRVSQTVASFIKVSDHFGGASDIYGGLGANGALRLQPGEAIASVYDGVSPLSLPRGHISNLRCDFISGHNDVGRLEVARVLKAALA